MRKLLAIVGVIAAAVAFGILFAWISTRGPASPPPKSTAGETHTETHPAVSAPRSNSVVTTAHATHPTTHPTTTQPHTNGSAPVAGATTNSWDDKLEEILTSETDDTNKVKQLFDLFPRLPQDGQVEVAQHLSNLVEDEDYAQLGQLLTNSALSEEVLDVLMSDILNRPNNVKLPMFLDIARNPDHPKAGDAKDLLELYLDEDYGTDWAKWHTKMKEWLKENPD